MMSSLANMSIMPGDNTLPHTTHLLSFTQRSSLTRLKVLTKEAISSKLGIN